MKKILFWLCQLYTLASNLSQKFDEISNILIINKFLHSCIICEHSIQIKSVFQFTEKNWYNFNQSVKKINNNSDFSGAKLRLLVRLLVFSAFVCRSLNPIRFDNVSHRCGPKASEVLLNVSQMAQFITEARRVIARLRY